MARLAVVLLFIGALSSIPFLSASESICPVESAFFLYNFQSTCPLSISPIPPLEVGENFLDRALTSKQRNSYTSVLFYACWCPFSQNMRPKFNMLGSMFPQIEHLAIEQSSVFPSLFSRYGIHSLPSILLVNQTSKVQYHGLKNLQPLVQFYEKTTGLKPVQYFAEDEPRSSDSVEELIMHPWDGSSLEDMMKRDSYLVFAVLFLCLRAVLFMSPKVLSHLKAFYGSYVPHLNLEIFGETSQLFGRILHMVDVRRIWTRPFPLSPSAPLCPRFPSHNSQSLSPTSLTTTGSPVGTGDVSFLSPATIDLLPPQSAIFPSLFPVGDISHFRVNASLPHFTDECR